MRVGVAMSSPQKVLICRYRYDPLDRLTSHTQSDTPERHRFYCKSRLATEVQGAVGHSIVQHDDLLLAQHQRQNGVLEPTLLATDLQRSVLNTLKSGRQPQPIAYSPYGHRPAESGLTSLLGFNGERPDPVTGHYLLGNGYRAFNPVLMRFNSPDSLSPFGKGGLNSYAYCKGDPANLTDPSGHAFEFMKHPVQSFMKYMNKAKLNKEIDNVVSKMITERTQLSQLIPKETTNEQVELIYQRHPTGLKIDDPGSLTSLALKATPPIETLKITPDIINRDLVREVFFISLLDDPITNNKAFRNMHSYFSSPFWNERYGDQLPSVIAYAEQTNLKLLEIAEKQSDRLRTVSKIIRDAYARKARVS